MSNIKKVATEYAKKVNGKYGDTELYPNTNETLNDITIKDFTAGYEYGKKELSAFISRCLTFGISLKPFEQSKIISASEKYKVPDDVLNKFNAETLNKYVKALDWSSREDSRDWSQGLDMLKEVGFVQQNVVQGHRQFVTMIWNDVA